MKSIKIICISICLVILNIQCLDTSVNPQSGKKMMGTWIEKEWVDTIQVLKRADELQDDNYGFKIGSGGEFIERKNAGWCGTPPISYANFDGSWELEDNNILKIEVRYWGGITNYKMEILSVGMNEIRVKRIYDN